MAPAADAGEKTWQQTKSERTRTSILEAAMTCFYERGYFNTTTESIAREAGVSRGAMLHHFPTRADLIKAAVEHINQIRLDMFTQEELRTQEGADHTRVDEGIDAYWRQLSTRVFVVFHELKVAARTDRDLARVLKPALKAYNRALAKASAQVFPDLAQSEAYQRTTFLTQYLLEGMAITKLFEDETPVPETMLLDWLKAELKRSYRDVRGVSRRNR
ncbi:MAG: helix-turn-helix domain-containing protein [Pseudomonadales bacterium]